MKTNAELKEIPANLTIMQLSDDGGSGIFTYGKLRASVIWSTGAGWDHVSISPAKRHYTPSWDEMCKLKQIFFYPEEAAVQIHPIEGHNINNVNNCLHLWRAQDKSMPLPPDILVGVPGGISLKSQFEKAVKDAYENPYRYEGGLKNDTN